MTRFSISLKAGLASLMALMAAWVVPAFAVCLNNLASEAPDSRFEVNGATVTDTYTGLIWLRCPLGKLWSEEQAFCAANFAVPVTYTWDNALLAANGYQVEGYSDWRLPNKNELSSIVDRSCSGPATNNSVFKGTVNGGYWTSTPWLREGGKAWHLDFITGTLISRETEALFGVYLVRSN
jgi:hypothetical protein